MAAREQIGVAEGQAPPRAVEVAAPPGQLRAGPLQADRSKTGHPRNQSGRGKP